MPGHLQGLDQFAGIAFGAEGERGPEGGFILDAIGLRDQLAVALIKVGQEETGTDPAFDLLKRDRVFLARGGDALGIAAKDKGKAAGLVDAEQFPLHRIFHGLELIDHQKILAGTGMPFTPCEVPNNRIHLADDRLGQHQDALLSAG